MMEVVSVAILKINGYDMPNPLAEEGYKITKNKIWSADTGRTKSGKMVGTIIAIKPQLTIQFEPLTEAQVALIDSQISDITNPYQTVEYWDETGGYTTATVYWDDPTYSATPVNGGKTFKNVTITGTMQ